MNRSKTDATNVHIEYAVGVRTGSMRKFERRKSGVDVEIRVGSVLCNKVGAMSELGQSHDLRLRRHGRMARGCSLRGVSMTLS